MSRLLTALLFCSWATASLAAEKTQSAKPLPESWVSILNSQAQGEELKFFRLERVDVQDLNIRTVKYLSYINDCTGLSNNKNGGFDTSVTPANNPSRSEQVIEVRPKPNPGVQVPGTSPTPGTSTPKAPTNPVISLEQIVNLGEKIWKFLIDNRPVVNARSIYANALPRGIECWDELESWQRPRSEVYRASYFNALNIEVVTFEFRLVYTWGGKFEGVGNYLTNVSVQYRKLDVAPFYNVDAEVEVPQVVNVAKRANPVAGMQVTVRWKVRSINHTERSAGFFVYGDGRKTDVLD